MNTRDDLPLFVLDPSSINEFLRRLQDRLDKIEGLRGDYTNGRWTISNNTMKYTDANQQVLHAWGRI